MPKRLSPGAVQILKRVMRDPFSLRPADVSALAAEDQATAKDAVEVWRAATRWNDYQRKYQRLQG